MNNNNNNNSNSNGNNDNDNKDNNNNEMKEKENDDNDKIPVTPNLSIPSIYTSVAFPDCGFILHPIETLKNYFLDLHISQYLQSLIPLKLNFENSLIETINQSKAFRAHFWAVIPLKNKIQKVLN